MGSTSGANGNYRLKVPDKAKVTPYIEAAGYHGIFLQTFSTHGRDLKRVNFQIPSDGIYLALAKSLAEGHGYHLLYLPGAPGGVHYPFGYPAFLAALWKLWPSFPANVATFASGSQLENAES